MLLGVLAYAPLVARVCSTVDIDRVVFLQCLLVDIGVVFYFGQLMSKATINLHVYVSFCGRVLWFLG